MCRTPAKISEREEDVVPHQELHKRITREEKRRMTADVGILAEEGIERVYEREGEREGVGGGERDTRKRNDTQDELRVAVRRCKGALNRW